MTKRRLPNNEVITILEEALAAMEIRGNNFFEIRAYQNAISILDNLTVSIFDIWENKKLREIPGVGTTISEHLDELFKTGEVKKFEALKKGLPDGMFALIGLRSIGAKKAFKLAHAFKLDSRESAIEKLKEVAENHKIQTLEGFGEKSEAQILEAINQSKLTKNEKPRMLYVHAEQVVNRIIMYMKECEFVEKIDALGSYRRKNPTVGDIDIVVATSNFDEVAKHFLEFPEIAEVLTRGEKKVMVVLTNDAQVDLRLSTPQSYGAMLQYNTGSKQHNILLRQYALDKGFSLSEYGIKRKGMEDIKEFATEEEFYGFLNLEYIPPEMRHGSNEVDLARQRKIPNLIKVSDIKGDLQSHTIASDGLNSLEDMIIQAIKIGYEYYGVTDHAPSVQTRGLEEVEKIITETREQIAILSKKYPEIKILFGYEVNILADATLALPDSILKELDFALGSIHTAFNQSREEITDRIIKALENPYINYIGHPSGRLLNERDPVDPDWLKVFSACAYEGKLMEINAQPNRLDLPDDLAKECVKRAIPLVINTDAHEKSQMEYMKYGVNIARRAGIEAKDIVNTLSFGEFADKFKLRLKK
ncbi:MAG TPA: DNA polymerase/3'-5' exonuclease PolX [Patescibacteria group bacterium]|nr:DNA polymerase/3'-5' exonuclease PolX [Patescibacteria group bacterium]